MPRAVKDCWKGRAVVCWMLYRVKPGMQESFVKCCSHAFATDTTQIDFWPAKGYKTHQKILLANLIFISSQENMIPLAPSPMMVNKNNNDVKELLDEEGMEANNSRRKMVILNKIERLKLIYPISAIKNSFN